MHDLLKEKNWYSKYVQKITSEEEKRDSLLKNLIKPSENEVTSDSAMEEIIKATQKV